MMPYVVRELSWWSDQDERLLGMVVQDHTDADFGWSILARDQNGCFRWVHGDHDFSSKPRAEEALRHEIAEIVQGDSINKIGAQGDETNAPIDLFTPLTDVPDERLHPYYKILRDDPAKAPGKRVLQEIGPWLAPQDPHLVREFQTGGFDQRIWEIYLWAVLRDFGYDVEHLEAPDFLVSSPLDTFTIEATTANPSESGTLADRPPTDDMEELQAYLNAYMPMKFGSPLRSKLYAKNAAGLHYWEREETRGKPFCLAIADFHQPAEEQDVGSMVWTQSALWPYLYGCKVEAIDEEGVAVIRVSQVESFEYGGKTVPANFFGLPEAKHVSAVIFSNAGTLAKFNRMGVRAGFCPDDKTSYFRRGFRLDVSPGATVPIPFSEDVRDSEYYEHWTQELQVFHNPNAVHPLPDEAFFGAYQHRLVDGRIESSGFPDTVLSSVTFSFRAG